MPNEDQTNPESSPLAALQDTLAEDASHHPAVESTPASAETPEEGDGPDAPRSGTVWQDVEGNPMMEIELGSQSHKHQTCFHVQLFGPGCLECKHLVEDAEVDFKKCHFTMGNTHCPAAYFKLGFVGERVKWEKKVERIRALPAGVDRTNRTLALLDAVREIENQDLRHRILGMIGI